MARRGERKGGAKLDPGTAAWLDSAAKNLATRTKQQLYEAQRIRIRLDVPEWLKDRYTELAKEYGTSVNQLGAFALAWWLFRYEREMQELKEEREGRKPKEDSDREKGPKLLEVLESSFEDSRSIRVECDVSLEQIIELLTNSAVALPEPEE